MSIIDVNLGRLYEQAQAMVNFKVRYEDVVGGIVNELKSTNDNWSVKLRGNFTTKIMSCQEIMQLITEALQAGHNATSAGANAFEELDKYLASQNGRETLNNLYSSMHGNNSANASAVDGGVDSITNDFDNHLYLEKVKALQQEEGFRQGDSWGYYSSTDGIPGIGCYSKAMEMQYRMTGHMGEPTGITDPSQIRAGDMICYYMNQEGLGEGAHWVYVISVDGDNLYIGEGNSLFNGNDGFVNSPIVNYRTMNKYNEFANQRLCDIIR